VGNANQKKYIFPLTNINSLELEYAFRQPIKSHVFLRDSWTKRCRGNLKGPYREALSGYNYLPNTDAKWYHSWA